MKKSFLFYSSYAKQFELLTDEQLGKLIRHLFRYVEDGTIPDIDPVTNMAFSFIQSQIDRDLEKWENVRTVRSEAGRKGGIKSGKIRSKAKGSKRKQKEAELKSTKQNEANEAVNVDVDVDVNVNDNVNDNVNVKNIYKQELETFIQKINQLRGTKYKYRESLIGNYREHRKVHSAEDMLKALDNAYAMWFADDYSPELLLRTKNKNGACDYIEDMLNAKVRKSKFKQMV